MTGTVGDLAPATGDRSHYYADGTSAELGESKVHAARVFARTGIRSIVHPHRHGGICLGRCVLWPPLAETGQVVQEGDGSPRAETAPVGPDAVQVAASEAVESVVTVQSVQPTPILTGDGLFAPGDGYTPDPPTVRPAWCTFLTDGVPMGEACGVDAVCEVLPPTGDEWAPRCGPHAYGYHGARRRPIGGAS